MPHCPGWGHHFQFSFDIPIMVAYIGLIVVYILDLVINICRYWYSKVCTLYIAGSAQS